MARAYNNVDIDLPRPTADRDLTNPYWSLYTAVTGGTRLVSDTLTMVDEDNMNTLTWPLGATVRVPIGTTAGDGLDIPLTVGEFEEAGRMWFLEQALNTAGVTVYLAVHNGDPDSSGVELTGGGYTRTAIASTVWEIVTS